MQWDRLLNSFHTLNLASRFQSNIWKRAYNTFTPFSLSLPHLFPFSVVVQSLGRVGFFETPWMAARSRPSPSPGACKNSCPPSGWHHPTTSSSVTPFSFLPTQVKFHCSAKVSLLMLISLGTPGKTTLVKVSSTYVLPEPQGPNVTRGKHSTFTGLTFTPATRTPSGSRMQSSSYSPTPLISPFSGKLFPPSLRFLAFPFSHPLLNDLASNFTEKIETTGELPRAPATLPTSQPLQPPSEDYWWTMKLGAKPNHPHGLCQARSPPLSPALEDCSTNCPLSPPAMLFVLKDSFSSESKRYFIYLSRFLCSSFSKTHHNEYGQISNLLLNLPQSGFCPSHYPLLTSDD